MQFERLEMQNRQSHVTLPRRALMESIQDENGPPEPGDLDDDEEAEEDEDSEDEDSEDDDDVRMMTMMMPMTMIPEMTELKFG